MRFFQPLSQHGLARVLAETRTRTHLSPGLIAIEKPIKSDGYSGFFDIVLPPSYSSTEKNFNLHWNILEAKKDKALTTSFSHSLQPFYPSSVVAELSEKDFQSYTEKFLELEDAHKHIYTLPISFINSAHFDSVLDTDVSLISLIGLDKIFNNQRKLAEVLIGLKEKVSPDIAIYLPGPTSPAHYSFLTYMGIDFFDNSLAYHVSKKGYFVLEDKSYFLSKHPDCYCQYCTQDPRNILGHNDLMMKNEIAKVRFALEEGILRELVEKDIHKSVTFAATLKHLDNNYSNVFRQRTPIISSSKLKCIGEESLTHPVIIEYRERIRTRFEPAPGKKIVLLLPCSAKKPYSFSRTHMRFRGAIKKAGKQIFPLLSEIIVTSPLSVVPRELENIYPARFYDIPVSGVWSEKEIEITSRLLLDVLAHYPKNTKIVNHMHGHGYQQIVDVVKEKTSFEVIDTAVEKSPTDQNSLNELGEVLSNLSKDLMYDREKYVPSKIRKLQATADFQYGKGTGQILFSRDIKIRSKYPKDLQIFREKKHIATLSSRTGYLSILPDIAQEIIDTTLNKLEFGAEYVSGSNIYAPGRIKADETILPNDEIFIIHENRVIATAKAIVSGVDMNKMTSGSLAVTKKKLKVKQ
ncbi:MAG: hypothetical protein GOP50_02300 [Candidatus Heimdallarchaeota archaeon]|nr:hypothetical protein [Candidatus Heimdallarchaeota archaeon]